MGGRPAPERVNPGAVLGLFDAEKPNRGAISAHSMALRSRFRAQIGHLEDGPMWVNGKTADLAKIFSPRRDAPGRPQVAYQVAGASSGPLKNGR